MAEPRILELTGRMDNATSAAVDTQINTALDATPSALILDVAGLTFVSSIGLRTLLMAAKRCQKQDVALAFAAVPPSIADLFEVSGLQSLFRIYPDRSSALAAVQ